MRSPLSLAVPTLKDVLTGETVGIAFDKNDHLSLVVLNEDGEEVGILSYGEIVVALEDCQRLMVTLMLSRMNGKV